MPLYEFHCHRCEVSFEALIRADEPAECPKCGGRNAEKMLSTVAAHVGRGRALPVASACPPSDAPPCGPGCCRLPG